MILLGDHVKHDGALEHRRVMAIAYAGSAMPLAMVIWQV